MQEGWDMEAAVCRAYPVELVLTTQTIVPVPVAICRH